jgi:hypothetical protein
VICLGLRRSGQCAGSTKTSRSASFRKAAARRQQLTDLDDRLRNRSNRRLAVAGPVQFRARDLRVAMLLRIASWAVGPLRRFCAGRLTSAVRPFH